MVVLPKSIDAAAATAPARTSASAARAAVHGRRPGAAQSRIRGVTSRTPVASPSHHVNQMDGASARAARPSAMRAPVPSVAAIVVAASAARIAKSAMSGVRSKAARPRANRFTSHHAATASPVLPAAINSDATRLPEVVRLTASAPAAIAGQTPLPNRSSDATAIPAGGHTADVLSLT
jgi:hypothetical protein